MMIIITIILILNRLAAKKKIGSKVGLVVCNIVVEGILRRKVCGMGVHFFG